MNRYLKYGSTIAKTRLRQMLQISSTPKFISNRLTWKCNSKCSTCGIWRTPLQKENEVEPEVYEKHVLKDPLVRDLQIWEMTGGEPLLYDGIFELTRLAFAHLPKTTQVRIGTNAINHSKLCEYIQMFSSEPLYISISIDGLGDIHDSIRGVKGNFSSVITTIEHIRQLQAQGSPINFGASVCVSKLNIDHIPKLAIWFEKEKIPFQLGPVVSSEFLQRKWARKETTELDFITPIEKQKAISLFEKWDRPIYDLFCKFWAEEKIPIPNCYALQEYLLLRPNGDMESCIEKQYKIGNIKDQTISEIWHSDRAKEMRKVVKGCTECNVTSPMLCDSLNNYNFHGTFLVDALKQRLWRKMRIGGI